jgi:trans-aconitate methyltransferase
MSDGSKGAGAVANVWDPDLYEKGHSFVWKYGEELITVLAPKPGERILDIGCGTGQLTAQIASFGAEVAGIDSSPDMISQARAHYPGLHFDVADAQHFNCTEPYDAVFSNAALHWMKNAEGVATTIEKVLKPGGRFVAELGGKGNIRSILAAGAAAFREVTGSAPDATLNPYYFPSVGEYSSLLEKHQLEVTYAELFDRPTPLEGGPGGFRDWVEMFLNGVLQAIPVESRAGFVDRLESRLYPQLFHDGRWVLDYRRLRITAVKIANPESGNQP